MSYLVNIMSSCPVSLIRYEPRVRTKRKNTNTPIESIQCLVVKLCAVLSIAFKILFHFTVSFGVLCNSVFNGKLWQWICGQSIVEVSSPRITTTAAARV
jgi:hypothetical protein